MNVYTVHLRHDSMPVLVREGWSWGAAVFGPLWLLTKRAWIPAIILLAGTLAASTVAPRLSGVFAFGFAALAGILGQDAVRWSLARRGYTMLEIIAARDKDSALVRLLTARPQIAERFAERLG